MTTHREKTLTRFSELMSRDDTDAALLGMGERLSEILGEMKAELAHFSETPPFDRNFVLRCIAWKNSDTWDEMLNLIRAKKAHLAMTLLRPLTEEMIFSEFLLKLPESDSNEFLKLRLDIEVFEKFSARSVLSRRCRTVQFS